MRPCGNNEALRRASPLLYPVLIPFNLLHRASVPQHSSVGLLHYTALRHTLGLRAGSSTDIHFSINCRIGRSGIAFDIEQAA
jgi:hypothetical protein